MAMPIKQKFFSPSSAATGLALLCCLVLIALMDVDATFVVRSKRQTASNSSSAGGVGTTDYFQGNSIGRRSGKIAVGTPAKEFRVAFNMTSSDLWLIHPDAVFNPPKPMMSPKMRYDSNQSSSSAPDSSQAFNSSTGVTGTIERDIITVAGVYARVQFGAAINGIPEDFVYRDCIESNCNFDVDGMFGLAPGAGNNSLLKQMTGALKEPVVTIYNKGTFLGGNITFGDVDRENCDPDGFTFVPLAGQQDKWATNLLEIRVGNVTVNTTGTTLEVIDDFDKIYVPERHFHAIGQALGANLTEFNTYYLASQAQVKTDIVLVIGEQGSGNKTAEIVLKPWEYTTPNVGMPEAFMDISVQGKKEMTGGGVEVTRG